MKKVFFDHIVHGGDYNPEQWIRTPEIWDEDMRLMKLAHINSASVGIFSWAVLEPEEGVYNFGWLDTMLDKMYANGIDVILATPSGARPHWLADKYPEVLQVQANGIRNEFGVRHNHCLTSPVYREKVRNMNRMLAERYGKHPAVKMWHVSNEYSGDCHCELCQKAFAKWLRNEYHNDIDELNRQWWNHFWSHTVTDWEQIRSPKSRGEVCSSPLVLAWKRFVSDSHISFFENEIAPLRELTPEIPVTANFMRMYTGIDYQKMAKKLDIVSWDNYPAWDKGNNDFESLETAFVHDVFRSMKDGQPFFMMESTPSLVNWQPINKLPRPGVQQLSAMQAIAHGSDSVQYFQWRKSRGSHEKFHGAVVDHCGHENTRVFRDVTETGKAIEKLSAAVGTTCNSKVAVIYDWENRWATDAFCGFNNEHRNYLGECMRWYAPFRKRGISTDVIPMDADFTKYDLVIAPFLYMLKNGTKERIEKYVANGGNFVATYLTGIVDKDDLCYLGGWPAEELKDVFGIWMEETDSLPEGIKNRATFNGKEYVIHHVCDIIHANTAKVLGEYKDDFYAGMPSATVNNYKNGKAWYIAFRNDTDLCDDVCASLIEELSIPTDAPDVTAEDGLEIRKRGELLFVLNFTEQPRTVTPGKEYKNALTEETVNGTHTVEPCGYLVLK